MMQVEIYEGNASRQLFQVRLPIMRTADNASQIMNILSLYQYACLSDMPSYRTTRNPILFYV